jgi:TRAP-type transport system periplasmic protein
LLSFIFKEVRTKMKKIQLLTIAILCLLSVLSISFLVACGQATPTTAPTTAPITAAPTTAAPTTIAPTTAAPTTVTSTVPVKPIELAYNINYNRTQVPGKYCIYFAEQINKASNGRLHVTVYPAGTLSAPEAVYETVVSGIADIGQHTVTYTPGRHTELEATHIPYSFMDGWVSSNVDTDFVNQFKPKSLNDVHYFFSAAPGPYVLLNVKGGVGDVTDPTQLKGQRIRASALGVDVSKAYGASTVSITVNESYDAAKKGLFDFMILPVEPMRGFNFAEVCESYTILPLSYCTMNIAVMNVDKWNKIPKDLQDVMSKVASTMASVSGQAWWFSDIDADAYFKTQGGHSVTIPADKVNAWVNPLDPIVQVYINQANAKGLPGADFVKYVQDRGAYYNQNHPVTREQALALGAELIKLQ